MKAIDVIGPAHWHTLRRAHIGSSEIAALFDQSPYVSRYSLWHAKAGKASLPSLDGNERVDWGRRLEPVIAAATAERMRWTLRHSDQYFMHEHVIGMGCTADYCIVDHEFGPGICEIKNVDSWEYRTEWSAERAPLHIELQVQHQLAVTGWPWAVIAVLVGGNRLVLYERRPVKAAIDRIEQAVAEFWLSQRDGRAPEAFGVASDAYTVQQLFPAEKPDKVLVLEDDGLDEVAAMLLAAADQENGGKRVRTSQRTVLLATMGDAATLMLPHHVVKRRTDKRGVITLTAKQQRGAHGN